MYDQYTENIQKLINGIVDCDTLNAFKIYL